MKKLLYIVINKLGYNIYNKRKQRLRMQGRLNGFNVRTQKDLLLQSGFFIDQLMKRFADLDIQDAEDHLKISFQDVVFQVESPEEFLILKEVYIDQDYNFITKKECVVIDIGTNVGIASIFFSQMKNVHKIYAFEPVQDTYELACKNFRENGIENRIEFYNFGLGLNEREEEFYYHRLEKGNSGIRGKLSPSYSKLENCDKRKVRIRAAAAVLTPIFEENVEYKKVVKMDCEGAEYEILQNLHEQKILQQIDMIVLEWHDRGPAYIEDILKENNFSIFSRRLGPFTGIIYATRNS